MIALIPTIPSIRIIHKSNSKELTIALILFSATILSFANYQNNQLYALFGPNILYRIFIFILICISLKAFRENVRFSYLILAILVVLTILLLLEIESRGGFITMAISLAALLYHQNRKNFILAGIIVVIGAFIYFDVERFLYVLVDQENGGLRFDINAQSESFRYYVIIDMIINIITPQKIFDYYGPTVFYITYGNYPHNIFAESYFYYGPLFVFISLILAIIYLRVIATKPMYLATLPIFIGANFSGDFLDNFIVFLLFTLALAGLKSEEFEQC
ncbi:MAG: hypothetical protein AAGH53_07205 [Pseudomonadota bacterium]